MAIKRHAKKQKSALARSRSPFSLLEDTDFGREQERRHQENIGQFKEGIERFRQMEKSLGDTNRAIVENTEVTERIDKTLADLIDATNPYVKLRRALQTGTKGVTKAGRLGERVIDALLKLGKGGAALLALYLVLAALLHGVSPVEAMKMLWQILVRP